MFNVGDKVVTTSGIVSTVKEIKYLIESTEEQRGGIVSESELTRFVSPEEVWQNLGREIASWVWARCLPIHDDEWAQMGNAAIDYLQENGVHPDRDKDTVTINLLISTAIAGIDQVNPF